MSHFVFVLATQARAESGGIIVSKSHLANAAGYYFRGLRRNELRDQLQTLRIGFATRIGSIVNIPKIDFSNA